MSGRFKKVILNMQLSLNLSNGNLAQLFEIDTPAMDLNKELLALSRKKIKSLEEDKRKAEIKRILEGKIEDMKRSKK